MTENREKGTITHQSGVNHPLHYDFSKYHTPPQLQPPFRGVERSEIIPPFATRKWGMILPATCQGKEAPTGALTW